MTIAAQATTIQNLHVSENLVHYYFMDALCRTLGCFALNLLHSLTVLWQSYYVLAKRAIRCF